MASKTLAYIGLTILIIFGLLFVVKVVLPLLLAVAAVFVIVWGVQQLWDKFFTKKADPAIHKTEKGEQVIDAKFKDVD
jgi:hypothetical protein